MAKIRTYTIDNIISDRDLVVGSDADNNNETKNFKVSDLRQYVLSGLEPDTGGNLKITTIVDNASSYTDPDDYFNNSSTPITVLQYEIIFLILNGKTFIFRKNDDVYGVGETQVVLSDFTEIDTTATINSNLQDLDSVLTEGNISIQNAKLGSLYLYNSNTPSGSGYVYITGDKNRFNFFNNVGVEYGYITQDVIRLEDLTTNFGFQIAKPSTLTGNYVATFQNSTGTVAYLSNIPSVPVQDVNAGNNVTVTDSAGVYTVNAVIPTPAYVINTMFRNSLTNTTLYQGGGVFEFDSVSNITNSVRIEFNDNISSLISSGTYGTVYFLYENGRSNVYPINFSDVTISGANLTFSFPLSDYWSETPGDRVSAIDVTFKPDCITLVGGEKFQGNISGTLSKYIHKW
jgi:hypothetical protein